MQGADNKVLEAIRNQTLDADCLTPAEQALLQFVRVVTEAAYKVAPETVQPLRENGWTDPQIAEAVYITALFAFFNRVADAFGLEDPRSFWKEIYENKESTGSETRGEDTPSSDDDR